MIATLVEVKTDKIKWGSGLRCAVALFVPLIVTGALNLTQYWPSIAFGVLFVGISDIIVLGAPLGYRMMRLGIITLVGALLTALGLVLGVNLLLTLLGTFVISLLCGAALAWGKPAALAGLLLNGWFLVSLSFQGGASQSLAQGLAWLIGGAIYMLLALLRFERQPTSAAPAQGNTPTQSPGSLLRTYFAFFKFTSPAFLFVLLKALAITIGTAIGLGFRLPEAHWIPVYTLIVLQADFEQTLSSFVQRVLGTILGAILAAVLLGTIHNPSFIALIMMAITIVGVAMHDANKLIYIFSTTVAILLLLGLQSAGSLTDVWARVLNVFIGALLAAVVVFLFIRPSQKKQLSSDAS